jgi:hypothetical protein
MSPFSPNQTIGVIVGIENYEISAGLEGEARWDLDGPASDAVHFAKWLKSRDVPGRNIFVFRSALNEKKCDSALRKLGIADANIRDAKQNTLENFFATTLAGLANGDQGQLFVLWGGHGILTDSEERYLYCEDVQPNTVRTIWLNDLLRLLRQFNGFRRQFIFVDACANAHEDTALREPMCGRLGQRRPPSGVEQYGFLAASAGQLAVNQRDKHSGLFSTHLFEAIEKVEGWPDFRVLEQGILKRFIERSTNDLTFNQRPVSITFVDDTNQQYTHKFGGTPVPRALQMLAQTAGYPVGTVQTIARHAAECVSLSDGNKRKVFYEKFRLPASAFRDAEYDRFNLIGHVILSNLTPQFLDEVRRREPDSMGFAQLSLSFKQAHLARHARDLLRLSRITTSEYQRIFSLLQLGNAEQTLDAMLDKLVATGPLDQCALFDFLMRVAESPEYGDPARLRACVKRYANSQHFADLEQRRTESRTYAVLVSIKPRNNAQETPDSFTVWLLENGRTTGRMWTEQFESSAGHADIVSELPSRLERILQEAIEAANGPVQVEIAVPLSLMRLHFDDLGIGHRGSKFKRPIAKDHPVVVRWRDRQRAGANWSRPWLLAGASIRANLASKDPTWRSLPVDPDESFLTQLENPPAEFLFMGESQPPSREGDTDWLQEVIIFGAPFAGWMVKGVTNPNNIPKLLDELLKGKFDLLPSRVPDARRDPQSADIHPLILLWDDPSRRHTVLLEEPV